MKKPLLRSVSGIITACALSLLFAGGSSAFAEEAAGITLQEKSKIVTADSTWTYNSKDVLALKKGDIVAECEDGVLGGSGLTSGNAAYGEQTGNFQQNGNASNGLVVGMSGGGTGVTPATTITYHIHVAQDTKYELFLIYDTTNDAQKQALFLVDDASYPIKLSSDKFAGTWGIQFLADSVTVDLKKGDHTLVLSSGELNRPALKSVNADFIVLRAVPDPVTTAAPTTTTTAAPTTTTTAKKTETTAKTTDKKVDAVKTTAKAQSNTPNTGSELPIGIAALALASGAAVCLFKKKTA